MCRAQDNSDTIEVIKCDECGVDDVLIEFEGMNLCRGGMEAIAWIKSWSKGEEKVRHPCPLCGEPMADFSIMDEMFFHCEECNKMLWIEILELRLYFDIRYKCHTAKLLHHCNNIVRKSLLLKLSM